MTEPDSLLDVRIALVGLGLYGLIVNPLPLSKILRSTFSVRACSCFSG